jgi:uncharacterized protein YraI
MRRWTIIFIVVGACAAGIGQAVAQPLTLARPAILRLGPGLRHPVIATAPAGAAIEVERRGRVWTRVALDGQRAYAASARLVGVEPEAAAAVVDRRDDAGCDYGYPYSGSGRYFTGLTELRHTGPLGFFLGYHRRWPC